MERAMDNPSIMSHVSIGTNKFEEASKFYDAVLATIGAKRQFEFPGAIAYGKEFPEFWLQEPADGGEAQTANGIHFGFVADSKDAVHAFFDAAIAAVHGIINKLRAMSPLWEMYKSGVDLDKVEWAAH